MMPGVRFVTASTSGSPAPSIARRMVVDSPRISAFESIEACRTSARIDARSPLENPAAGSPAIVCGPGASDSGIRT